MEANQRRNLNLLFACIAFGLAQATAPAGRFVITAETVQDTVTGLLWQRTADKIDYVPDSFCSSKVIAGQSGWRLPTLPELRTIYDVRGAENEFLPQPTGDPLRHWSSTQKAVLDFNSGYESWGSGSYIRCVK